LEKPSGSEPEGFFNLAVTHAAGARMPSKRRKVGGQADQVSPSSDLYVVQSKSDIAGNQQARLTTVRTNRFGVIALEAEATTVPTDKTARRWTGDNLAFSANVFELNSSNIFRKAPSVSLDESYITRCNSVIRLAPRERASAKA
jgi:hypothetical protein